MPKKRQPLYILARRRLCHPLPYQEQTIVVERSEEYGVDGGPPDGRRSGALVQASKSLHFARQQEPTRVS